MNYRNRVLASFGALALMASTVLPSFAATDDSEAIVNVAVTSIEDATVSITIAESSTDGFDNVAYNYSSSTDSTGALVVTVTDERGTAAGWTVTLMGTDFVRGNTTVGENIPIGNLSLIANTPTRLSTAGTIPATVSDISVMSSSAAQLWLANTDEGDGVFETVLDGTLEVPAGTLVDSYASTITAVIDFAP